MGKRTKIFSQWLSAAANVQASTSTERSSSKEDVRKEHELLSTELDSLYREHKKLKQFIEQLERDYEESKDYDPLRRYEKLKGMIKRTILHIRLNRDDTGTSGGLGVGSLLQGCRDYTYQIEAGKKREERYSSMSRQEMIQENENLRSQIKDWRRKCSIIRDLIQQLERNYEASKRVTMMQRYRLMKSMVKKVIHDNLIQ